MKTFNEYAEAAKPTVAYPLRGSNMMYPAIKLAGEAGEVADKIGKHVRNETAKRFHSASLFPLDNESRAYIESMSAASLTDEQRRAIVLELGDVLWYINALAEELSVTLEEIAAHNILKLQDRRKRGVVLGEGDNR